MPRSGHPNISSQCLGILMKRCLLCLIYYVHSPLEISRDAMEIFSQMKSALCPLKTFQSLIYLIAVIL